MLRLLDLAGGELLFRCDEEWEEQWPSAIAHLLVPATASAYTFGSDHPFNEATAEINSQPANHVIVYGADPTTSPTHALAAATHWTTTA